MARHVMKALTLLFAALSSVNGYWLMGIEDFITTERLDPIVNPGRVSGHVHSVLGGSNFRMNTNTNALRQSQCTSIPIPEDKSNYWFPHLYFQWANGSFTSMNGGAVMLMYDYLFSDTPGTTTAFPDDLRMLSGDPTLRTYDPNSYAQQAVTFLCLDFNGVSTRWNSLPPNGCPSGIRAQINFPSCWDGKNLDSSDHKSHVAFPSGGPDSGTCSDPKFPVTLPRIFIEVYWASNDFDNVRSQAMNSTQPFVYSYGDPTGYGYHADFLNGWDKGVLQKAVDNCHCNPYGDPTCCVDQGIFHMNNGQTCRITKAIDEQTTGTLNKLPGNNPVQKEGVQATMYTDPNTPALLSPIYAYTGDSPTQVGTVIIPPAFGPTAASSHASSAFSTKSASSTVVSGSLSSAVALPSSSVPSSGSMSASSKPAVSFAAPSMPSIIVPPASLAPFTSMLRSAIHMTSVIAQPSPVPSLGNDEVDCEEADDEETDSISHGATSTNPTAIPTESIPGAPVFTSASVSHSASSTALIPAQTSSSSSDDHNEDCEEEDDDETNDILLGTSPAGSESKVSADSVHHTPTTTVVGASTTPTGNLPVGSVSNSQPACATGKFRHKRLRKQQAQQDKRSFHHARSFHDRFVRSHHARAF
ncbi:hypothetical protein E4T56_gene294 [Termitomyces sp. T112]|nr:hypothetical protein E4T56_gene294 [Termitomyces sp. T112]